MIDLYLRTSSEKELFIALPFLATDWKGDFLTSGPEYELDIIGTIYKPLMLLSVNAKGVPSYQREAIDSAFYANLRCSKALANKVNASIQIQKPVTPYRMWLGD